ncbi:MAG: flavodoxin [Mitsuokella jalaludinii]|uniref:flavodoxin n=1 Tax=Mitsuokella jalaludinii TaxID=187979 RepID=UPI00242C0500|nr:flavodoxin [Mitsuokella jalaludinii]MDD7745630.1 flavodoxin [Mitsuokella jalaludinii]
MMTLVLGGCGLSSLTGESSGGQAGSSAAAGTASSSSSGTAAAAGSKTLVVYYSATGRTERVAEVIARERQADIMKLVPSLDYTEADLDYNDAGSRVSREHDDASLREKIQPRKPCRTTGPRTTRSSSAIRSGGALQPGRSMPLSRPTTSRARLS